MFMQVQYNHQKNCWFLPFRSMFYIPSVYVGNAHVVDQVRADNYEEIYIRDIYKEICQQRQRSKEIKSRD